MIYSINEVFSNILQYVEIRIVHYVVDNERHTITEQERRYAILEIIFKAIFYEQNDLWEWRNFARYLRDDYIFTYIYMTIELYFYILSRSNTRPTL